MVRNVMQFVFIVCPSWGLPKRVITEHLLLPYIKLS